ncbi:MAG: S9 family peptidase [Anaerolineae bacterium]
MQKQIPIEEVARYPRPGMAIPGHLAFSPDDALITYLFSAEGDLRQRLYAFDPATGRASVLAQAPDGDTEMSLTLEEKLRRERQRQRAEGITRYAWAKETPRLLIPLRDGIYVKETADAPLRRLVSADAGPLLDPQLSPGGTHVAYVQHGELTVAPVAGGEPQPLTTGAQVDGITHGLAEYIAQEELHREHGFWWSPDGAYLAFTEVDERHVPRYRIVHQGRERLIEETHRYPFAGQANAQVRLGVVPATGGEPVWMDLGDFEYLARVRWWPDGSLVAQVQNREQTELRLVHLNPRTGAGETLLVETNDVWVNLHAMLKPLDDGRFLWASERTGFRHLYLYDGDGRLIRPLTEGAWMVTSVAGVDEARGLVYFTGTRDGPRERHLYVVPLEGGEPRRITHAAGTHKVTLDHACRRFVDVHSALDRPPTVTLRNVDSGGLLDVIHDEDDPRIDALGLTPPEPVTLESRDGVTLHGLLYRPTGPGPHPTVVSVYGGPHAQLAVDAWGPTADLQRQHLRSQGFAVFVLDNRGSAGRGLAFEGALRRHMGSVEVQDQVDGVRWLIEQGIADPVRVGITGWSYGGYMTLMCLLKAPEVFRVGVAGAPVTAWDGYDTHYTERYMGTPDANPEGYTQSSALTHVEALTGELLIVHGLIDENVHFRHSARLIKRLIEARKRYALLLFPDERHMPRSLADRIYLHERIRDFFLEHLT